MKPTVYVSGRISGLPNANREAFAEAIAEIRDKWPNAKIHDPSSAGTDIRHERHCQYNGPCDCCEEYFSSTSSVDYRSTIIADLRILANADVLWLTPDWQNSLGCLIEAAYFVNLRSPDDFWLPNVPRESETRDRFLIVFPECDSSFGNTPALHLRSAWARAHMLWLPPGSEPMEHDDETIARQDAANSAPTDLEKEYPT